MELIIAIALIFAALFIIGKLLKYLVVGVTFFFAWASDQGFVGVAVFFACCIMFFPFALAACLIAGAIISWSDQN